jgi:hypothetical protein
MLTRYANTILHNIDFVLPLSPLKLKKTNSVHPDFYAKFMQISYYCKNIIDGAMNLSQNSNGALENIR